MSRTEWVVGRRQATGRNGGAATSHSLATAVAVGILKRGGNAIDAACAATFALGVVEPFNTGLGGVTTLVYWDAKAGRASAIDGTGRLPSRLRPDSFELLSEGTAGIYGWRAVRGDANLIGPGSVATPGTVAALSAAHQRWGRLPFADVIEPAIVLATDGFEADWYFALACAAMQSELLRFPTTRSVFLKSDNACYRPPFLGLAPDRVRQPDLARTLQAIGQEGPGAFYEGAIGARIVEAVGAGGGYLADDDLRHHDVVITDALATEFQDRVIYGGPANSGAPTLFEALNILSGFDIGSERFLGANHLHLVAEVLRVAFADRFRWLADSGSVDVPIAGLLSPEYAALQRDRIERGKAQATVGPGTPGHPDQPEPPGSVPSLMSPEGNTSQVTVVDADRNVVSATSTIGSHFGSCFVAGETGVLMNNGTMWFDPVPGTPNSIGPRKRMLVAGCPTVIVQDGRASAVTGAPGGRKIISAVLQVVLNMVTFNMGPQAAVSAPRIHTEGGELFVDSRVPLQVRSELERRGHTLRVLEEGIARSSFARPVAIAVDGDRLTAGVHPTVPADALLY